MAELATNKRPHQTNFRCHFLCKNKQKDAIKNLLGEPGVNKKGTLVMDPVEAEFRDVEERLNLLLASDKLALSTAGFVVEDNSSRTYHYKNSHLFWIHSFRKEWLVDIERACVTVSLSYGEPIEAGSGLPYVDLSAQAEMFQQGRESRINERTKSKVSLVDLERLGILNVVTTAFAQSARCLP